MTLTDPFQIIVVRQLIRNILSNYDTNQHYFCAILSIIGRNRHIDNDHSPGPGAYNTETSLLNKTMPSIRIGSAKRDGLALATDSPGPGAYAVKNEKFFGKVAPRVV